MNKITRFLPIILCTGILLTGCGETTSLVDYNDNLASTEAAYSKGYDYDSSYDDNYEETSEMSEADTVKQTAMIIKNADITVEVKSLENFANNINKTVDQFGGYFENSEINNYDSEYETERYAYFTVRIPQEKLDEFLNQIDETGSIKNKSISSEDVSLEYIDVKAHINALQSRKESLEALMESAESVSDIIEISNELSNVQHQLDSVMGQKKYLESQVSYSTVRITAEEERYVAHPFISKIKLNFRERFADSLSTPINIIISVFFAIPTIIVVGALAIIFIIIIKKVIKKFTKK